MKPHLTLLLCSCFISNAEASDIAWQEMRVSINSIDKTRGGVVALYVFLEEGFPIKHDRSIKQYQIEVSENSLQLVIEVPNQPFALKAHHDEDRSGAVSKNWTGFIPAEGLAFSSGARLNFGPPSFEDAVMILPPNKRTQLQMIYP